MERRGRVLAGLGIAGLVLTGSLGWAQEKPANKPSGLKTIKQKVSYSLGRDVGLKVSQNIKTQEVEVDHAALIQGFADALKGAESPIPEDDLKAAIEVITKQRREAAAKRRDEEAQKRVLADPNLKAVAEVNAQEGAAYLKENKAKKGVKTTASGLQYKVLKEGKGKKPTEDDIVEMHYHGTLPNGEPFDSSVERKKPAKFAVNSVVNGLKEALQMMPVGSKWRVVIPANLAYGWYSPSSEIGPNQLLIFEVELLGIESK